MNLDETKAAIKLHGVTHRIKERTAASCGNGEEAGRCAAIAAAAEGGRLLAPRAIDHYMPDLLSSALEHGLVDGEVVPNRAFQDEREPVTERVGNAPLAPPLPPNTPGTYP